MQRDFHDYSLDRCMKKEKDRREEFKELEVEEIKLFLYVA